ncbi:solute carrier family 22 member 13 [Chanos chanos]|uniref:Solute carrier family 22 member 13 n=1 Tax=Chanos chanos TaxID=29144 RepID=A0A6J2VE86_CHACN|nr:solute carrier family 22 member 13-like [Chanos chanos]
MADFGEILRAVGDFGLFQKLLLFGLCFPNLLLPFHLASLIFNQADTGHHCNTDWILRIDANLSIEEQLNLTVPWLQDGSFSSCEMFIPVDWDISAIREHGLNETTSCTSGWVHYDSIYESTIITDFDLVCENGNAVGLAQTVFMAGILVGSLLFGPFVESFGRQRATQIPVVLMVIFTVVTGLSPNFYMYLVSQFIVGISYGGYRVNCIVLATEWIGVKKRSYASFLTQVLGGVGQAVLAGIIYFVRNWRIAQFVMAAPIAVVACYIWFVPESARWLLDRGKTEEAKKLILKAAAINKRTIPDSILMKLTNDKPVERGGIKSLFASPILRRYFLYLTFGWCALNLSYYCLSLNVGKFGLDIFVTQLIFGLTEVPAHLICLWLLEAGGRKLVLMSTLLVGGFVCLLILAVPQDSAIAITVLATAGRFLMNGAGSVCNIYVQELFPTSIRQTAAGLGATATRVAGMLSPPLNLLEVYHWTIPTLVFSTLSLIGGALAFLLPETRRKELPDSTEEAEGRRKVELVEKKELGQAKEECKATKM